MSIVILSRSDQASHAEAGARTASAPARLPQSAAGARLVACAGVGAIALVAMCHTAIAAPATRAVADPARLQVTAREFRLVLSRPAIRAGDAVVELVNLGEDDHDLALRRVGPGAVTRRIRTVAPGGVGELETRLRAGRFVLWCTLADHRARGMRATLVVR